MIRSIKRTRQIEDFVIEKLARRGLITEKQKENPAEFVKGLCHVESMTTLCKRRIIHQENIFINQNTLFKTELAYDEFKHLLELDYKKEWFNEVKQIIQIHFVYKALYDQGPIELIREILAPEIPVLESVRFDRIMENKLDLVNFVSQIDFCIDSEKVKKFMNTKNHSYFRQQVHQIEIDDSDLDFFVTKKDEFPLSFSIICHVIEFISNRIEDEKEKLSTEENPPLTPPENEDEDPKMKCSSLLDNLKEALSQVPINPQDITLLQTTLPPNVDACSSSLLRSHILAIGRSDACVTVMDSWSGKSVDLRGHSAEVWATSFSNNGTTLLTGSRDKTVRLWNLKDFDENDKISMKVVYRGHSFGITCIDHAAFDLYFATSSMDTSAQLWHFERETSIRLFAGHQETVNCVKFHPNSNYLFTGSDDRSIRLWDINSGKCERVFFMNNQGAYKASVSTIDLSPSGKLIAAGYDDGTIRIFDIAETRLVGEYFTKTKITEEIEQIKYNSNGTLLASISNGTCRIWSESNDILKLDPKLTKGSVLSSLHWKGVASLDLIAA